MAELDDQVRQLLDIEVLKRLKARYFRTMDQKRWDEFATCFTEACVMDVPEAGVLVTGSAAIASALSGILDGVQTCHHGHMPEIDVTGPDTATGIWAMFDYVEFPAAADGTRNGLQGYGHYEETYRRVGGVWKIDSLRLTRLRIDALA